MHPSKKRVSYHHNFSQTFMFTGNHYFLLLGGTVFTILLPTQMHFSKVFLQHDCTGHVKGSCMGNNISITSASFWIIRIANQGVVTKCSSFQICHLIVTMEFTWGYLQLDHPVTCGNIKCYSQIQIITWMKSCNFYNNLILLTLLLPCVTKTEFLPTI